MDPIMSPRYATRADDTALLSLDEFAQQKTNRCAWIGIKQKGEKEWTIYDVTDFIDFHPGGEDVLLRYAGRDASNVYNGKHGDNRINEIDKVSKVGIIDPKTITRAFELTGSLSKSTKTRPKPPKPQYMSVFCEQIAKDEKLRKKRKRPSGFEEESEIEEEIASTSKNTKKKAVRSSATTGKARGRPRKEETSIAKKYQRPAHKLTGARENIGKKSNIKVALHQAPGNKDPGSRTYPLVVSDIQPATTTSKRGRPPKVDSNLNEAKSRPNTDYETRDEEARLDATREAMEAEVNRLVEQGFVSPHDVPLSIHLNQELDSARRASLSGEAARGQGARRVSRAGMRRGTGCAIIKSGDPRWTGRPDGNIGPSNGYTMAMPSFPGPAGWPGNMP
ncbi:uncharacterized protein PAC_10824 [Phialocephala subalpina]|uniref:Cytochrome b5 heme-binding domain-containing protein n=1 Tax=Phialocephala subalpina TaxID=576137 RepID=A0A1L7X7C7_9HELO|nr:uncharacterized protein PAC_10824 [Phialocephala subalpina]